MLEQHQRRLAAHAVLTRYLRFLLHVHLHDAQSVGAAWLILIGRNNQAYVRAMAEGKLATLESARERAQALVAA